MEDTGGKGELFGWHIVFGVKRVMPAFAHLCSRHMMGLWQVKCIVATSAYRGLSRSFGAEEHINFIALLVFCCGRIERRFTLCPMAVRS